MDGIFARNPVDRFQMIKQLRRLLFLKAIDPPLSNENKPNFIPSIASMGRYILINVSLWDTSRSWLKKKRRVFFAN